jgi:hypothetical protein
MTLLSSALRCRVNIQEQQQRQCTGTVVTGSVTASLKRSRDCESDGIDIRVDSPVVMKPAAVSPCAPSTAAEEEAHDDTTTLRNGLPTIDDIELPFCSRKLARLECVASGVTEGFECDVSSFIGSWSETLGECTGKAREECLRSGDWESDCESESEWECPGFRARV